MEMIIQFMGKLLFAMECWSLATSLVRAALDHVLLYDPLRYHEFITPKLVDGIFKSIRLIPKLILHIILVVLQIPITIVWNFIPGLSWIADPPNLSKWLS